MKILRNTPYRSWLISGAKNCPWKAVSLPKAELNRGFRHSWLTLELLLRGGHERDCWYCYFSITKMRKIREDFLLE